MQIANSLSTLIICTLLSACTQTYKSTIELGDVAINGLPDASLSEEQRLALGFAAIYVKYGKHPKTYIALAKATHNERVWAASDGITITTINGQVVRSYGLPTSLGGVYTPEQSPFDIGLLDINYGQDYPSFRDFPSLGLFGAGCQSSFNLGATEQLMIAGSERNTQVITEHLNIPELGFSVQNTYWVETTGTKQTIWRSEQFIAPDLPVLRLEVLLPYYDDV